MMIDGAPDSHCLPLRYLLGIKMGGGIKIFLNCKSQNVF